MKTIELEVNSSPRLKNFSSYNFILFLRGVCYYSMNLNIPNPVLQCSNLFQTMYHLTKSLYFYIFFGRHQRTFQHLNASQAGVTKLGAKSLY